MPSRLTRTTAPIVLTVGAVLVLAACTGAPPAEPSAAPASATAEKGGVPEEGTGDAGEPAETTDAPDDEPSSAPSPLEEIFGSAAAALSSTSAEERAAQHLKLEEGIAACMAEQGFTYHVVPWDGADDAAGGWTNAGLLESGYGVSTRPAGDESEAERHPNDVLEDSMSEAELKAFKLALGGPVAAAEDFVEGQPEDVVDVPLKERGCVGKVEFELYGDVENVFLSEEFGPLFEEMMGIYATVEGDPRLVEARNAWSECVADAGFPGLTERWEAAALIEEEWSALWGEDEPKFSDPKTAEFRERELALARADVECTESTKLAAVTTELNHEAERAFIELHRAELEGLAAALTEQNSR